MAASEPSRGVVTQCGACGSISGHLRGCEAEVVSGHVMGRKVRKRTKADKDRLKRVQALVRARDGRCRMCLRARGQHCHHVMTENEALAAGWPWSRIDSTANLILVCFRCHDVIHSAAGRRDAVRNGFLIDTRG